MRERNAGMTVIKVGFMVIGGELQMNEGRWLVFCDRSIEALKMIGRDLCLVDEIGF